MDSTWTSIETTEPRVAERQFFAQSSAVSDGLSETQPPATQSDELPLPIFQRSWWQTIARGNGTLVVERVSRQGAILGQLSYVKTRNRLGFALGDIPHWTHFSGPWLNDSLSQAEKARVLAELVSRLPRSVSLELLCHPRQCNAELVREVFERAGFCVTAQNTYAQSPDDPDVMSRISIGQRKNILRAAKKLNVIDVDADEFIRFYAGNLGERAAQSYSPLEVARNLITAGLQRNFPQVKVLAAVRKDAPGASTSCPLDAAIACVWDHERYYYFMSTRKRSCSGYPDWKPNADAIKLLIVHAMQHARSLGLIFDADGVTEPGTETLYRDILKMPRLEQRLLLRREFGLYTRYRAIKLGMERISTRRQSVDGAQRHVA